jgi:hypothetical protein
VYEPADTFSKAKLPLPSVVVDMPLLNVTLVFDTRCPFLSLITPSITPLPLEVPNDHV